MTKLFYPLLFAMACNLDTVLLASGYRLRGARLSPTGALIIAAVTTVITTLALVLGQHAALLLASGLPEAVGGLVLIAMGLWLLLECLRRPEQSCDANAAGHGGAAWVALSVALGVNNASAGIAAGVSGVDPLAGGAANLAVTFLSLALGHWLGGRAQGGRLEVCALPASGVLLLTLGMVRLCFR